MWLWNLFKRNRNSASRRTTTSTVALCVEGLETRMLLTASTPTATLPAFSMVPAGETLPGMYTLPRYYGFDPVVRAAQVIAHSAEHYTIVVQDAYQRYLQRTPSADEINPWLAQMANGMTDERLQAGILGSAEYYHNAGGTPEGWVRSLYQNLLGRSACQTEVDGWMSQLADGVRLEDVAYGFTSSLENQMRTVARAYTDYLARPADASEVQGWVGFMRSGHSNEDLLAGIVGSDEYYQLKGQHVNWLDGAYQDLLHRPADDAEKIQWEFDLGWVYPF